MLEEREMSTARHIRCFGDLYLASTYTYACIDIYDLFRRVVNMISSLEYTYLYLVVLHSVITNDPHKKLLCCKWKEINRGDVHVPYKTIVDVLNDVLNVPKLSYCNFTILQLIVLQSDSNDNDSKPYGSLDNKKNINTNRDGTVENGSHFNVPVLLLSSSNDHSGYIQPVEPELEKPLFKLKKRPFHINWNHEGDFDINKLHKRYGGLLTDDDIDIITDDFLWPMIKFKPSLSSIDKLSLILTGYLYSGEMDQKTPERFYSGKNFKCGGGSKDSFDILDEVYQDTDFKRAEAQLTQLKIKLTQKMSDIAHL